MSSALILAIVLPATLWMSLLSALIFMTAIYTGAAFGVAIPAILMGVPGSPAAVATSFDGYPMTQRGEHNLALGLALAASTLGHMGAYLILFLGIGWISHAVLKLGPLEMLLLMLWGLTLIAVLRGRYVSRSLLSGLIGILIATIGLEPARRHSRHLRHSGIARRRARGRGHDRPVRGQRTLQSRRRELSGAALRPAQGLASARSPAAC